jgi:hypothetical protein
MSQTGRLLGATDPKAKHYKEQFLVSGNGRLMELHTTETRAYIEPYMNFGESTVTNLFKEGGGNTCALSK